LAGLFVCVVRKEDPRKQVVNGATSKDNTVSTAEGTGLRQPMFNRMPPRTSSSPQEATISILTTAAAKDQILQMLTDIKEQMKEQPA